MTLTQMNYIITISETGSLNKAAEALYISQPSLTNAVKELEKELGIIIFNRSGRGVTLTNDGTEFLMDVCPQTKCVEGSNYVDVNFKIDPRTHRVIMMGAMDNLVKGAAGQAVQNMNLMFGFKEAEGLLQVPMCP